MSKVSSWTIRQAGEADATAIARVVNAAYRVEDFFIHGDRTYEQEVLSMMASGRFLVAMPARNADEIDGAIFLRTEGEEGYFGMLAVDPPAQRQGLGRKLVEAAEETFAEAGCRRVRLVAPHLREELFPWYRAQGYVERRTLPFPEPEKLKQPAHMVELVKELA